MKAPAARTLRPSAGLSSPLREYRQPISNVVRFISAFSETVRRYASHAASSTLRSLLVVAFRGVISCYVSPRLCWRLCPRTRPTAILIVDDTICVVDPETYGIVDVIPSSIEQASSPSAERPALALSADQMQCVYSAIPKDQPRSDLHLRLALGAEIRHDVELFGFPEEGLACAPGLAAYRYILVEDDVVIVDPIDYVIAAVVSG